jgi:hypothetical protein
MLRNLESNGHHDIELTKYGKAVVTTKNGQRCYKFPDAQANEAFDYVLKNTTCPVKADNFKAGVRRSGFAGGALISTMQLVCDPVGNILRPGKAVVVVQHAFGLAQNKP